MSSAQVRRAESHDDIKPLVELCKAGKLFEVQKWIVSGKPVNGPPRLRDTEGKARLKLL